MLAQRLGSGLREGRVAARLTQRAVAQRVGTSQGTISALERGHGASSPLELWATVAAAVGRRLTVYLEATSGAELPRDMEHLKRQRLVIETARLGGWRPGFEVPVDPLAARSGSVDVLLTQPTTGETVLVEVWDWLADVGEAVRSSDAKLAAVRRRMGEGGAGASDESSVQQLWVLRGTRRNRDLIAEFEVIFDARFPGSSAAWLRALTEERARVPDDAGLLWTDVRGSRLVVRRRNGARDGPTEWAKHPR